MNFKFVKMVLPHESWLHWHGKEGEECITVPVSFAQQAEFVIVPIEALIHVGLLEEAEARGLIVEKMTEENMMDFIHENLGEIPQDLSEHLNDIKH